MKIVRNSKTGEYVQTSDDTAEVFVRSDDWAYCSKQEWKQAVRDAERYQRVRKKS